MCMQEIASKGVYVLYLLTLHFEREREREKEREKTHKWDRPRDLISRPPNPQTVTLTSTPIHGGVPVSVTVCGLGGQEIKSLHGPIPLVCFFLWVFLGPYLHPGSKNNWGEACWEPRS